MFFKLVRDLVPNADPNLLTRLCVSHDSPLKIRNPPSVLRQLDRSEY